MKSLYEELQEPLKWWEWVVIGVVGAATLVLVWLIPSMI